MKYKIIAIGKIKQDYLKEAIAEYTKRLRPYGGVQIIEIPEGHFPERPSEAERLAGIHKESEFVLRHVRRDDYLVLLDLHGKTMSSEKLASYIQDRALHGTSEMVFAIGGAFGVGDVLRKRAQYCLSFGAMTYTHQMIRYLLVEQLYRAEKINRNEPYHW